MRSIYATIWQYPLMDIVYNDFSSETFIDARELLESLNLKGNRVLFDLRL